MPRMLRVEYPGAIYHIMSRGNRREAVFLDEVDRHDFLKTLAEACRKTGWQVHAWCLMGNHFHLVVQTPQANLVDGMRWLLSTYSNRFNHRRKKVGHLFSGRYKALHVEGHGAGYLRTVCDYVHLNPVRARLLRTGQRLIEYPWSSFAWHLAGKEHRPAWLCSEPLFGEHGITQDNAQGRREFERRLEARRQEPKETGGPMRRGWYLGTQEFKKELLARMEGRLGANHAGQLRREAAEANAQRLIESELKRQGWTEGELKDRAKTDPVKVALAARIRRETTVPIRWLATRLHMGTRQTLNAALYLWRKEHEQANSTV
jgi:REP element-mobilizing transposase RayT